ncbi:hypothetical protein [Streptomyces sp. UNOB3_S3]|uniref:hypothetical protein n=1 Tax=Streptomyces sp. UNOB3_S3 TaxID=2871682 RepID=UPI001E62F2A0|nr:hypothetical protein [Streptomyces sp. UNOB3_S3]MCC3773651.1 hypothetical protein [Streptomyces sp. UNOB3_S3]
MEFRITAGEEAVLLLIASRLDAGDTPTVEELSAAVGRDVRVEVASLSQKGWIGVRGDTVLALSPMALQAVRNLRFGYRGEV